MRRLLRIIGGYLTACFAAGSFAGLVLWLFIEIRRYGSGRSIDAGSLVFGAFFLVAPYTAVIFMFTVIPTAAFVVLAEARGIRDFGSYLFAGLAIALLACWLVVSKRGDEMMPFAHVALLSAAGMLAGGVYWFTSGRFSGKER